MTIHQNMFAGLIYKSVEGPRYEDQPDYDCYRPADHADDCKIGDCFVVNEEGETHPDNSFCVPVSVEALGAVVGKYEF